MDTTASALPKIIAGVRMATSVFFLLFGEHKVAGLLIIFYAADAGRVWDRDGRRVR